MSPSEELVEGMVYFCVPSQKSIEEKVIPIADTILITLGRKNIDLKWRPIDVNIIAKGPCDDLLQFRH